MHRRKERQMGTPAFKGNSEAQLGHAGLAHVLMVSRESAAGEPGAGAPRGGRAWWVWRWYNFSGMPRRLPPGRARQMPLNASSVTPVLPP